MRLLIFGFGYSAQAVWERMRPKLEKAWGTTRDSAKLAAIEAAGVSSLLFDASSDRRSQTASELCRIIPEATHVLVSIAPDASGDPVLRHFREALATAKLEAAVYLSTVGVYGDHDGAWVDETSECRPVSTRSRQRLVAEAEWQRFSGETGVPVATIRLAGIYGPGRGPFEKIRSGTTRRIVKDGQVFNRIHVDDIARIVEAAFECQASGLFNGVDNEPAPPQDVLAYAAELLGLPAPPEVAFEDAELTPMARSFYGENKRVRNAKIKRELGVSLRYPSYREGLLSILQADRVSPNSSAISS